MDSMKCLEDCIKYLPDSFEGLNWVYLIIIQEDYKSRRYETLRRWHKIVAKQFTELEIECIFKFIWKNVKDMIYLIYCMK